MTRTHIADVTDPITGELTRITAASPAELERQLDSHLTASYPLPPEHDGCGDTSENRTPDAANRLQATGQGPSPA